MKRGHGTTTKIKEAIASHDIFVILFVPDEYVPQILNIDNTGQKLCENYVPERINGDVSLWDPVKKQKNMMHTSGNKKHAVKCCHVVTSQN